eukprot:10721192-Alexandrium_andersonii.AAC.1
MTDVDKDQHGIPNMSELLNFATFWLPGALNRHILWHLLALISNPVVKSGSEPYRVQTMRTATFQRGPFAGSTHH